MGRPKRALGELGAMTYTVEPNGLIVARGRVYDGGGHERRPSGLRNRLRFGSQTCGSRRWNSRMEASRWTRSSGSAGRWFARDPAACSARTRPKWSGRSDGFAFRSGRPRDPSALGELLRMFRREFEPFAELS